MTIEIDFDHFSLELQQDPFPVYQDLRERCPVAHSTSYGGWWLITNYKYASEVTHHPEVFSNRLVSVPRTEGDADVAFPPLNYDPPQHGPWKRLLTSGLGPKRAEELEAMTRESARALIDRFASRGTCDAAKEFARLLPIAVLIRLLGLEPGLEHQIAQYVHQMIDEGNNKELSVAGFLGVRACIVDAIEVRRGELGPDMLSFLMQATIDGRSITEDELILIGIELLTAGIDTTFNVIGSMIFHLATHPDDQRRLREHPELIPTAREEFLRAFAPVMIGREVKSDVELNGCAMKAGDQLLIALGSACRDSDVFPDGDEVQLDREQNPHLAFGVGPHRCVGSHIARMELNVALEEFLTKIPEFSLEDDQDVVWSTGPIRGPRSLKIRFAPVA